MLLLSKKPFCREKSRGRGARDRKDTFGKYTCGKDTYERYRCGKDTCGKDTCRKDTCRKVTLSGEQKVVC